MCRFTFYLGREIPIADLVTRPENSLINQSSKARERPEPLNGDGFGVVWYTGDDPVPGRFRSVRPAWNNDNLTELARVTHSRCIMAHVRASTSGRYDVAHDNCHPFRSGPFAFMHNGDIPAFARIRRPLMESLSDNAFASVRGNTDSEHVFALVMEHLRGHEQQSSCELLAEALENAIGRVLALLAEHAPGTHAYLNLLLSDGTHAVASRFSTDPDYIDSLYVNEGARYHCDGEACWMAPPDEQERAVLISSEPLNEGPRWQTLARNQMALVDAGANVDFRSLVLAAA